MSPTKRHAQRRSFGALRKLPSKRWQASYTGPDLIRHTAPDTFQAKVDAEGWLSRERALIERGEWSPPDTRAKATAAAAVTMADYSGAWMASRELKPRTRAHYQRMLDRFILPAFGDVAVRSVTTAAIRLWHTNLPTGATYKAHAYALLKAIYATAVEDQLVPVNPCLIRGASKVQRSRVIRPATLAELDALTEAMPDRLRLLVQLSAWCALRFGEVTELRRRDLNLDAGLIRIRRGVARVGGEVLVSSPKTVAGIRDVHVPPHLLPMVQQHLRDHAQIGPDGLLFWAPKTGGQLPHSSLLYRFNLAKVAAGRPDLTPHALRHTGAVLAAQSGATIAELQARLGHTTAEMAMRYQHASEDRDLVLAAKLSEMAAKRSG